MRASLLLRYATAAFALGVTANAACPGERLAPTEPYHLGGQYRLEAINGETPPVTLTSPDAARVLVIRDGRLELEGAAADGPSEGPYFLRLDVHGTMPGWARDTFFVYRGRYSASAILITLGNFTGTHRDGALELRARPGIFGQEAFLLTFVR